MGGMRPERDGAPGGGPFSPQDFPTAGNVTIVLLVHWA